MASYWGAYQLDEGRVIERARLVARWVAPDGTAETTPAFDATITPPTWIAAATLGGRNLCDVPVSKARRLLIYTDAPDQYLELVMGFAGGTAGFMSCVDELNVNPRVTRVDLVGERIPAGMLRLLLR